MTTYYFAKSINKLTLPTLTITETKNHSAMQLRLCRRLFATINASNKSDATSIAATCSNHEIKLQLSAPSRESLSKITPGFRDQQIQSAQKSMQAALNALIIQNQQTREWVRQHRSNNGSMPASEHHEQIPSGVYQIHVNASRNNTFVTLTDWQHRVVKKTSGGQCGLTGSHRGTSEAGTRTASRIASAAVELGAREVYVSLKGFGTGRETAFRSLVASGLNIRRITDRTPIPHGGCKPKKARRV